MKLEKLPFYPEGFLNHRGYREAKDEFYRNAYEGKMAQFNCEILSVSGLIIRSPGDKVIIREYDSCGMFRFSEIDGSEIYGLWKPDCIDIVTIPDGNLSQEKN